MLWLRSETSRNKPIPKYETDYLHCMAMVERLLRLDKEEHP